MKIEQVTYIDGITLMVFYTPAHCWQFAYFERTGKVRRYQGIFYTAEKAVIEGRQWVKAIARGGYQ